MASGIVIADYNPAWVDFYKEEAARILALIGDQVAAIEHVGSTAVPGLGAKPVIDIMIGVEKLDDAAVCIAPIESLGYLYKPEHEVHIPERRYFQKLNAKNEHTHHVHIVEIDGDFWEDHLLFRDYLRTHPETAYEYERLKRKLAQQTSSRLDYTDSKTDFITEVLEAARQEYADF